MSNTIPKCPNCNEQMKTILYREPDEAIEKYSNENKIFYRGLEQKNSDRDSEERIVFHCYNCDRSYSRNLKIFVEETQNDFPYNEVENYINELIEEIANDIIGDLDYETIDELKKKPEYSHFGFGLFIRNNYIYNNDKIKYRVEADSFSSKIYDKILEKICDFDIKEKDNNKSNLSKWIEENNINLNRNLKYYVIHQGTHVDGYARGQKSQPFICSCYKQSLINLIKLFDRYIQYDCVIQDRNELLLELLGLPKYFEVKIRECKSDWSLDWIDKIDFKDNICPCCNKVKFTPLKSYNIYISDFKETYKKERRKRELTTGVYYMREDFIPYVMNELLTDKYKGFFDISDDELKEILKNEYNLSADEINQNIKVLNMLDEDIKHDYLFSSNYLNKKEYKEILKSLDVTENFDNAIYEIYKNRSSLFKKEITKELKELAKPKKRNLVLKVQECNWGLRTLDEWDSNTWEIYDDMSINIKITYGDGTDEFESSLSKNEFDKVFRNLEKAKEVNIISDGCDGSAWEFIQYQENNEIWKFKLGYIYGNSALENIEKILRYYP